MRRTVNVQYVRGIPGLCAVSHTPRWTRSRDQSGERGGGTEPDRPRALVLSPRAYTNRACVSASAPNPKGEVDAYVPALGTRRPSDVDPCMSAAPRPRHQISCPATISSPQPSSVRAGHRVCSVFRISPCALPLQRPLQSSIDSDCSLGLGTGYRLAAPGCTAAPSCSPFAARCGAARLCLGVAVSATATATTSMRENLAIGILGVERARAGYCSPSGSGSVSMYLYLWVWPSRRVRGRL